jgi:hypothetical protein
MEQVFSLVRSGKTADDLELRIELLAGTRASGFGSLAFGLGEISLAAGLLPVLVLVERHRGRVVQFRSSVVRRRRPVVRVVASLLTCSRRLVGDHELVRRDRLAEVRGAARLAKSDVHRSVRSAKHLLVSGGVEPDGNVACEARDLDDHV